MDFRTIQFHPGPRVVSIVLDRPPLNVINVEVMDELDSAWEEIEALEAQVVVLTGSGERGFSAGVDVADHTDNKIKVTLDRFNDVVRRFYESDCITIAAIHGHTLGGGAELAMVCDFVLGADDTMIGFPEVKLGCFPPVAAALLPRAIGHHKAAEMLLIGESINATEAHRIGILNRIVPRTNLSESVDEYVSRLLEKSSTVLELTKRALREGLERRFDKALDKTEKLYLKRLVKTADMSEGIQAFLEKRPAAWKNR
jgi:cyclohexa-1,5-dienecarbonyl-CoA hydratase